MPPQAEDFTAAQPVEQQEHERRIQRVVFRGIEERAGLGRGPGGDGLRSQAGSSASRATLRMTSSSRMARVSAEDSTAFMTWTLRTDCPAASWPFRNAWTRAADKRSADTGQAQA